MFFYAGNNISNQNYGQKFAFKPVTLVPLNIVISSAFWSDSIKSVSLRIISEKSETDFSVVSHCT